MAAHTDRRATERRQAERRAVSALDLRDAEVIGYRVEAPDGYVGRAADYCVEEESWVVTGLLVTVRGASRVFVPLNAIDRIDQHEKTIFVTPTREDVRQGLRRSTRPSGKAGRRGFR